MKNTQILFFFSFNFSLKLFNNKFIEKDNDLKNVTKLDNGYINGANPFHNSIDVDNDDDDVIVIDNDSNDNINNKKTRGNRSLNKRNSKMKLF